MDDNLKQLLMPALLATNCTVMVVMGVFYFGGHPSDWSLGSTLLRVLASLAVGLVVGGVTFFVMKRKQ